jgi:glycosyltransferase involved in cell wall biosynthesis
MSLRNEASSSSKHVSPQISYIIPAYNCEGTIAETLDSILDGNLVVGDEIVIVNDCSTDATKDILNRYDEKYDFVHVVNHAVNKGGAAARNTAVENARNSLIFCLDSDNVLEPASIPELKRYLLSEKAHAAAFQELRYFTQNPKNITHKWVFQAGEISFEDCLASVVVPISSGNYLYTKESWILAGGYPEYARALDAWGFGLRQLALGQKMVVLKGTGYLHRHGHESYWVRETKKGKTSLTALQILIPFIDQLKTRSVNYAMGPRGRNTWFENMEVVPLETKSGGKGKGGTVLNSIGKEIKHVSAMQRFLIKARTLI